MEGSRSVSYSASGIKDGDLPTLTQRQAYALSQLCQNCVKQDAPLASIAHSCIVRPSGVTIREKCGTDGAISPVGQLPPLCWLALRVGGVCAPACVGDARGLVRACAGILLVTSGVIGFLVGLYGYVQTTGNSMWIAGAHKGCGA